MNLFDKICAAMAGVLAVVFLLLGAFGIIFGAKAHFSLPPVLGVLPAFVGWGVLRSVMIAWKTKEEQ